MRGDFEDIRTKLIARATTIFPNVPNYPAMLPLDAGAYSRIGHLKLKPVPKAAGPFFIEARFQELFALVDRCIATRNAKMELEAKALELALGDLLFDEQLAIRRQQVKNGLFHLPVIEAANTASMHAEMAKVAEEGLFAGEEGVDIRTPGNPVYVKSIEQAAEAAHATSFQRDMIVRDKAQDLATSRTNAERIGAEQSKASAKLSQVQNKYLEQTARARSSFENANEVSRTELLEAEARNADRKRALYQTPDSGLNFRQRLTEMFGLFDRDFRDIVERAPALEHALHDILGLQADFNVSRSSTPVTDLALALRDAASEMSALLASEYSATWSFSLASITPAADWSRFLAAGNLALGLDHTAFGELNLVRLRGVQLIAHGAEPGSFFSGQISLPTRAQVSIGGKLLSVDQSGLPRFKLGDVGEFDSFERRGYIGGKPILDASPIGNWEVSMSIKSSTGQLLSSVRDVQLLVTCAVSGNF